MDGIQSNSEYRVLDELFSRDFEAGRHVPIIVDAPGANSSTGAGADNQALRRIGLDRAEIPHGALGPCNHRFRLRISASGTIENQHLTTGVCEQEIPDRIDSYGGNSSNLGIGPAENSLGRHVSVCFPRKYQNGIRNSPVVAAWTSLSTCTGGKQDLIIHRIDAHLIVSGVSGTYDFGVWPLDDPNGRFLSVGPSPECQDRLCQSAIDDNFVVNRVISKTMHGPADLCLLACDRSNRRRIVLRQPGEGRNLRMDHSVRYQYLFPFAVIDQSLGFTESQ